MSKKHVTISFEVPTDVLLGKTNNGTFVVNLPKGTKILGGNNTVGGKCMMYALCNLNLKAEERKFVAYKQSDPIDDVEKLHYVCTFGLAVQSQIIVDKENNFVLIPCHIFEIIEQNEEQA